MAQQTKCETCFLRRKKLFTPLTSEEVAQMQRFKVGEMVIEAGTPFLMEGSNSPQLYTALRGMGLRYKILPDGRRQVVNLVMPGDFIGLQASLMGEMGHSVEASTHMTLCVFDRSEFWNFFKTHPRRAFDVTWLAAVEEHFLGEVLTTVGQRTAYAAMAWALLSIFNRAELLGITDGDQMRFPFKQQDLADALGLSLVHTNKTLAKLRQQQLATLRDGELVLHDRDSMMKAAGMTEVNIPERPIM